MNPKKWVENLGSDSVDDVEEAERRHGDEYDTSVYNQTGEYTIRDEEIRDLDTLNLENFRDSERRGLRQQIKENNRVFWLVVLLAVPFGLWLMNVVLPWTQGFSIEGLAPVVVIGILAGTFLAGRKSLISTMSNYNIVGGYLQEGAALLITKDTDVEGQEVVRGFTTFGWRASTLKIKDISRKLSRYNQRQDYEDTVRVRLKPEHTRSITNTLFGDLYLTHGKEVRIDPQADAVMTFTRPDLVDKDEYNKVLSKFKNTLDLVESLRERIKTLKEQKEDAERRASRREKEIIDQFVEQHTELRKAESDTVVTPQGNRIQYGDLGNSEGDNNE